MRFVAALLASLVFLQGLAVPRFARASDPVGSVTSDAVGSAPAPSQTTPTKSGRRWWPWVVGVGAVAAAIFVGLVIYSVSHIEVGSAYSYDTDVGRNLPIVGGSSSGGR